jgi:hypothetical protein
MGAVGKRCEQTDCEDRFGFRTFKDRLDFHHVTYLSRDLRCISARHLFNIYINLLTPGSSVRLHGGNPLPAFTVPAILLTSIYSVAFG